jgi:hypothetical protein
MEILSDEPALSAYEIIALVLGVILFFGSIVFAIIYPNPTKFQYIVFRTVMSFGGGFLGSFIGGVLTADFSWPNVGIKAGGAAAFFAVVYVILPASDSNKLSLIINTNAPRAKGMLFFSK